MKNADMPAMPLDSQAEGDIAQGYRYSHTGLTKREHFAAMAMQGILSNHHMIDTNENNGWVADFASEMADALLARLEDS